MTDPLTHCPLARYPGTQVSLQGKKKIKQDEEKEKDEKRQPRQNAVKSRGTSPPFPLSRPNPSLLSTQLQLHLLLTHRLLPDWPLLVFLFPYLFPFFFPSCPSGPLTFNLHSKVHLLVFNDLLLTTFSLTSLYSIVPRFVSQGAWHSAIGTRPFRRSLLNVRPGSRYKHT
ncbi:uncharacterized protein F4807DRAFT_270370 [Annulohypoxylon truncatum]|uniref:uncharacterized protein n=1 Tax=Annulohypoxylon truncatum TaxID=327061 RepID=UPI002007E3E1|nr:uncharacterized protein F4807DRAFT_270370 [Annulohypoxylon truncatum]KAI1213562.1 hypothetical protein F4807DRAFT_270370 [Annulohypoxylon truncatum]